jgi:hypothetical protein
MYKIKVNEALALVEIEQGGLLKLEELQRCAAEVRQAIRALRGRAIKILVDTRSLHPVPPGVDDEMRSVQEFGVANGVVRVAQIVENSVVLLQRTRILREAGTSSLTRMFRDIEAARQWLVAGADHED